jgi:hypothetical protein
MGSKPRKSQKLSGAGDSRWAARIDGVRYDELAPMLLNEVQQQAGEIHDLKQEQIHDRRQHSTELNDLKQELHAALLKLQGNDDLVAQRLRGDP